MHLYIGLHTCFLEIVFSNSPIRRSSTEVISSPFNTTYTSQNWRGYTKEGVATQGIGRRGYKG